MNKKFLVALGVVMAFVGFLAFRINSVGNTLGAAPDMNIIDSWTTNTSSTIDVGARQILSANSGRVYAHFTNDSDTAIYLNFSSASTTLSAYTVRLNATGGTYDIGPTNLYTGVVYASTTAAGKKMLTIEK